MKFKDFLDKLMKSNGKNNGKNNISYVIVIVLIGVLILLVSSFFTSKPTYSSNEITEKPVMDVSKDKDPLGAYEEKQKKDLENILSSIDGIGKVQVMITFESGREQVPATDINNSVNKTEEKDTTGGTRTNTQNNTGAKVVMKGSGSATEAIILKTLNPKVISVVIVAEGAKNKELQYKIMKTVSGLYNIPENKVDVYSMKK